MKPLYLILLIALSLFGCREKKERPTIIVDMSRGFTLMEGDSVFWQMPVSIIDSTYYDSSGRVQYTTSHSLPQDTLIGLINFKPLVIITDGKDTTRYYGSDTVRLTSCSFNNLKWEQISGPNIPTSIPDEDSFVFRNPFTGLFDIKIHRKDLPKNK